MLAGNLEVVDALIIAGADPKVVCEELVRHKMIFACLHLQHRHFQFLMSVWLFDDVMLCVCLRQGNLTALMVAACSCMENPAENNENKKIYDKLELVFDIHQQCTVRLL